MPKKIKHRSTSPLHKKSRRGFQGFPVVTVAFYGPNDQRASKVAVAVMPDEGAEPAALERWFSEQGDVRYDPTVEQRILSFIQQHQAKSVTITDRIIGCPHEEGIDYPEGEVCPQYPFWAHRDRWSGEIVD